MKPKVEALGLNFKTGNAIATVLLPTPGRDKDAAPPPFAHLELFVEQWCGLQGDLLHLKYDSEGYPMVELISTDRAGKAQRYHVIFEMSTPATRTEIDRVDWRAVGGQRNG